MNMTNLSIIIIHLNLILFGLIPVIPNNSFADELTIRADWYDRGNVVLGYSYGNNPIPVINGGQLPNYAEYKIEFPQKGRYLLEGLYSAEQSRPVDIFLDGKKIGVGFKGTTGTWHTRSACWEKQLEFEVDAGIHTIKIENQCFPHVCALRFRPLFDGSVPWSVPRSTAVNYVKKGTSFYNEDLPWEATWFDETAIDRKKKGESGHLFTDHFGAESITALVPEELLEISILDRKADSVQKKQLNNELTWCFDMFQENDQKKGDGKIEPTFHVQVQLKNTALKAEWPILAEPVCFELSQKRLTLLLGKTLHLAETLEQDYGADEFHGKTFHGRSFEQVLVTLRQWLKESVSIENKEVFAKRFFDTVRIFSELGRSNPLLDFDNLVYVRREDKDTLGLVQNWQSNSTLDPKRFNDSLVLLKIRDKEKTVYPQSQCLFAPPYPAFMGDLDLHFDADRLLFSSTNPQGQWNVFEVRLSELVAKNKQKEKTQAVSEFGDMKPLLPFINEANNYDACWLADDSVLFTSSACYISVPCVNGSTRVTNTFRRYNDGTIRRLTFDQEHNWCPTMLADGRILYLRWEYTDVPHVHARLLFQMNPDGTGQTSFYGSNSYWPNSMFYTKQIPNEPSRFVTIVSGHHGVRRMGELTLFDIKKGRSGSKGAVQRICAQEREVISKKDPKYEDTLIVDNQVDQSWPKFLHPYPLSSDYYLVSAQLVQHGLWGIYLVDTEDNMILLSQEKGFVHFEPIAIRKTQRPPVLTERVDVSQKNATVFIADLYSGEGLKNVPRGTIKNLRLFTYNYLFPSIGGPQGTVGMEGPWDIKRVMGTVPVQSNGSVMFQIPANTPIAIQPLDENGCEVQLMRSWFTAMPGEVLSCIGCHEDKNSVSPSSYNPTEIARMKTETIRPWFGKERGFSFTREVQPILDRYCIACHNGSLTKDGVQVSDLRGLDIIKDYHSAYHSGTRAGFFSTSYTELHRYVRRPGMESDYHLLMPTEFSPNTTDLFRLLVKGHYGVQLDAESWDRIITWIDMNAPYHGYWSEQADIEVVQHWNKNRLQLQALYANITDNQENILPSTYLPNKAAITTKTSSLVIPKNPFDTGRQKDLIAKALKGVPFPDGEALKTIYEKEISCNLPDTKWSFNAEEAKKRQESAAQTLFADKSKTEKKIELAPDVQLHLRLIPAGNFTMGAQSIDKNGKLIQRYTDEKASEVVITKPFWMGTIEVTNRQYELFDPKHDSRVESRYAMQFGVRGFYVNAPERPVVRVSWYEAVAFCQWLSKKTGMKFRLPNEAEWEYACRAGTTTPFWYGDLDTDFSSYANLADKSLVKFVCHPYFKEIVPLNGSKYDYWLPCDNRFNDGGFLSEKSGTWSSNPFGLYDMHGNVAEWTLSQAKPGPWKENDGRNTLTNSNGEERVVRGGSWHDRPMDARSEFRTSYRPWQGIYNVGIRVAAEIE